MWAAIEDELAADGAPRGARQGTAGAPAPAPVPPRGVRRWVVAGVAAVVALAVGVVVGVAWSRRDPGTSVARADLVALPAWTGASGSADLRSVRGVDRLEVRVAGAPGDDGFRQVWLATSDLRGMVSLGVLDGGSGTFDVPSGLDLDAYTVVDVSQEPFDGDPAHSDDSVVRGTLER